MKKETLEELEKRFMGKEGKYAVIVFKQGPYFKKEYTELERSYVFDSNNNYFQNGKISNSLFANCLDGKDLGVRLDWIFGKWQIDYCYEITKEEYEKLSKNI